MSGLSGRRRKARDGDVLHEVFLGRGAAVSTEGERRKIIEGPVSARIQKSDKFGWELHLNTYIRKGGGKIELRNPSDWDRIELFFPLNEETKKKVAKSLRELAGKIEGLEFSET